MTPEQVKKALVDRDTGWSDGTVEIVSASDVDLVEVQSGNGLFKCVDGRPAASLEGAAKDSATPGPKALGGIYAIAAVRGVLTTEGLQSVAKEVSDAGYAPCVHGDDCGPMGCGFFKLWSNGTLQLPRPEFTAEEGKAAVLDAGGTYEVLDGQHEEKVVMINLVANTTLEPNRDDQRFVVDAWVGGQFGINTATYVALAARTVEELSGVRAAKIIIP